MMGATLRGLIAITASKDGEEGESGKDIFSGLDNVFDEIDLEIEGPQLMQVSELISTSRL